MKSTDYSDLEPPSHGHGWDVAYVLWSGWHCLHDKCDSTHQKGPVVLEGQNWLFAIS